MNEVRQLGVEEVKGLDISSEELRVLQATLGSVRIAVKMDKSGDRVGFFHRNGRWIPPARSGDGGGAVGTSKKLSGYRNEGSTQYSISRTSWVG